MEIIGYCAAILVGLSFGLIGSGGSILTMPILVYLFSIPPTLATSYSLFIVGTTCLTGAIQKYRHGFVDVKTSLLFGILSVSTVLLTRKYIVPAIPENISSIGTLTLTKSMLTMVLLAALMLLSSVSMIRNSYKKTTIDARVLRTISYVELIFCAIGIGFVTGMFGVGGGFLLIPTLVLIAGMPMKNAIGTSLTIISLNTLVGILGDWGQFHLDWALLAKLIAIAIAGVLIGNQLGKKISGAVLKAGFGWFVLVLSIYIITRELFFK